VTTPSPGTLDAFQVRIVAVLDVAAAARPVGTLASSCDASEVAAIVHGWPVPGPPLWWAGSVPCVHQLAL
jgi:hypothetical protein